MRFTRNPRLSQRRIGGMTLIELMVALGIGSLLMIGVLTVYTRTLTTFRINESIARLQDNARLVFGIIEPEIRMASFWGLRTRAHVIDGRARDDAPLTGAVSGDCSTDWAIDLDAAIAASDDGYDWPDCDPGPAGADAADQADTLVVRRVGIAAIATPAANSLYLQTTLGDAATLFMGDEIPAGFDAASSETHELVVSGFYVSQDSTLSTQDNPVPSLRRKRLRHGNAGDPKIVDEEVVPGIEDMQIRFGVDTDAVGGPERGIVDRYVDPDDGILDPGDGAFNADAEILTVRIWLRLRSEQPETGVPRNDGYRYADQASGPMNDGFRRIVVAKTIYLRNARPPE